MFCLQHAPTPTHTPSLLPACPTKEPSSSGCNSRCLASSESLVQGQWIQVQAGYSTSQHLYPESCTVERVTKKAGTRTAELPL